MAGHDDASSAPAGIPSLEIASSWIHCSFDVEGRQISASVKRFEHDERQRIAAEVAWFAQGVLTGAESRAVGWTEFLQRMLTHNVAAITLDEEGLGDAPSFWHQVVCRMFEVLMIANELDPAVVARISDDYPQDGRYSH